MSDSFTFSCTQNGSKRSAPWLKCTGHGPSAVAILLARRFRGKRVIFPEQLDSGSLLAISPYQLHGVLLRYVDQDRYLDPQRYLRC